MARQISELIPNPDDILRLEPEELGGVIMEFLHSMTPENRKGLLNRYNFSLSAAEGYPHAKKQEIAEVIMEGWAWLENEGLLVLRPQHQGEWVFITRRGARIKARDDSKAYA